MIVYSGLVKDFASTEVDVVLAHELGHVLSEHYIYQTALLILSSLITAEAAPGALWRACRCSQFTWCCWSGRAAELSRDRASALVVGDPLATCQMLMRLAGGAIEGMNLDAFLAQAARTRKKRTSWLAGPVRGSK